MDVAVTGSSGLIGTKLVARLTAEGHRAVRVVRRRPEHGADEIYWKPSAGEIDAPSFEGLDAVVHLAGAGIGDKRWSDARKKVLYSSRVDSTKLLADTLAGLDNGPGVFLSGSAIGFYGDRGEEELTESSTPGDDFNAEICINWEKAAAPAVEAGVRTVNLRTGIVLDPDGPFLGRQLPLFKLGLGGRMGSADRWLSWISIDDEVDAIMFLLTADVAGPVNLTAPNPVRNGEFTDTIGRVLHRPTVLPVPMIGPKLLLGSEAVENLINSAKILPTVLQAAGYDFHHRDIEPALRAVLGKD
ncbi:MAG: TIGR01777 family oxidoreductase [Acidimicrobiales bacterium]